MPASLLNRAQAFFFFSGATGLIYQVLWTRRLTLTFGHTVLAVSTVLTAFMAGLALGSVVAGRWSDRAGGSFLKVYGYLEGFIGLWAFLTLPLLRLVENIYIGLASGGMAGVPLQLACFASAAVVLVPPTTAMGATVPILTRLLVTQPGEVGPLLSRLYGINTLGALLGAALGGFLLLPVLGLKFSLVGAALVNLAIAYLAVKASNDLEKAEGSEPSAANPQNDEVEPAPSSLAWMIPFTFALAGFASMTYQVAWNRTICLSIGSSVYAFSTILVVFLGGLGLGSLLYPKWTRGRNLSLSSLGWLYLAIAVSGALTIPGVALLPRTFLACFSMTSGSYLAVIVLEAVLVTLLLFLPTLLMGLGFPLATALYSSAYGKLGRSVGEVYGANTLGCIAGAFLTGFGMIPMLGAQWSLKTASLVYLFCALNLLLVKKGKGQGKALFAVSLVALVVVALPRWDPGVMAAGVGIYTSSQGVERENQFKPPAIYLDGLSSTVTFHFTGEHWSIPHMRVNGKVDASRGAGDRLTQYFLAYLPCLLHPAPRRVAVIGLGGGFTVEAVTNCPRVERIECAELEPAVVAMAEPWKPYNSRALEDPRVQLHINDGRTFVLAAQGQFDVLISEPSNPWIAGIGNLFTRDFYARAREKLSDNGVMCQWFNIYAVSSADMKMVLRGFYDVFPHGHVWQSSGGDMVMIGSLQELPFRLEPLRKAWEEQESIQRHFFETGLYHPDVLTGHYLMSREEALKFAGPGVYNTDDRPVLEFSAPFSLYDKDALGRNAQALWSAGATVGRPPSLEFSPELEAWSLFGSINRSDLEKVRQALEKMDLRELKPTLLQALILRHNPESGERLKQMYESTQARYPDHPLALPIWGDIAYKFGQFKLAADLYRRALSNPLPGCGPELNRKLGFALLKMGEDQLALEPLKRSADLAPSEANALALAGGVLAKLSQNEQAHTLLTEALKRNPIELVALQNLSVVLFNTGQPKQAERFMQRFLGLEPTYAPGWRRLGIMRKHLGDSAGSARALRQALTLDPEDKVALETLKGLR